MDGPMRSGAALLAGGVPLLLYLATASDQGYWLDAGEFVAASVELGIAHPPGHPLAALVGRAFALLPVGSLTFRVALASAAAAAVACAFLYGALHHTLTLAQVTTPRVRVPLALGGTWAVAGAHGFWFQAVRPEVYALQAALILLAVERLLAFEARYPHADARPLYVASLAFGLALANHHYLAFLLLPAAAPTLARLLLQRGVRPLLRGGLATVLGLCTYLYLPLRAQAQPLPNLGEPVTPGRLWWVVTAEAFQDNQGVGVAQPLGERWADVLVHYVESLHAAGVILAVLGLYVALRGPATRRAGYVWGAMALVYTAGRAWLGFVRDNPDALGYLMPAMAALVALGVTFVGVAIRTVAHRVGAGWLAVALALMLPVAGAAQVVRHADRASLATFADTDAFAEPLLRNLPPRAVVVAHAPQTVFLLWGHRAAEQLRPDVTVVPVPFIPYPGMIDAMIREAPELRGMLGGYVLEGELRQPDLQSLASERALLVEMDPRVPPALYETLAPRGLYHEVLPDGATDADARLGARSAERTWTHLYERLPPPPRDPETRNQLLWRHYNEALYFAGFGDRTHALAAAERGLAIRPEAQELVALRAALERHEQGPLDVTPFMVGPTDPP